MRRTCPLCGDLAEQDRANRWRPFCSERCKLVDLSRWLDGSYAIPGAPTDPGQPATADEGGDAIQERGDP